MINVCRDLRNDLMILTVRDLDARLSGLTYFLTHKTRVISVLFGYSLGSLTFQFSYLRNDQSRRIRQILTKAHTGNGLF